MADTPRWVAALIAGADRLRFFGKRHSRLFLILGLVLFAAGVGYALIGFPRHINQLHPLPLLLFVVLINPLSFSINALRFKLTARIAGKQVNLWEAFRITLLSTLANMLPLPGGVVVRTLSMHTEEHGYGRALAVSAYSALIWIGVVAVICGTFIVVSTNVAVGSLFVAGGAPVVLLGGYRLRSLAGAGDILRLVMLEVALTFVGAWGLMLALQALASGTNFSQAMIISFSNVAGAAIGVFPAGLGASEVIAAGMGTIAQTTPGEALLASALTRVAMMVVVIPLGLVIARRSPPERAPVSRDST